MLISLTLIILGIGAALVTFILVRRFGSPPGSHYRDLPGAPEIFGRRMAATVQVMERAYGSSTRPLPCDASGQPNS